MGDLDRKSFTAPSEDLMRIPVDPDPVYRGVQFVVAKEMFSLSQIEKFESDYFGAYKLQCEEGRQIYVLKIDLNGTDGDASSRKVIGSILGFIETLPPLDGQTGLLVYDLRELRQAYVGISFEEINTVVNRLQSKGFKQAVISSSNPGTLEAYALIYSGIASGDSLENVLQQILAKDEFKPPISEES